MLKEKKLSDYNLGRIDLIKKENEGVFYFLKDPLLKGTLPNLLQNREKNHLICMYFEKMFWWEKSKNSMYRINR